MKMLTSKVLAGCVFAGSALFTSSAISAPVLTNSAGSFANWGGFDWASNGTAVVDGFNPTIAVGGTDTFDLTYWAKAAQALNTAGQGGFGSGFETTNVALLLNQFEYTVVLKLNETATCTATLFGSCTAANFAVNSGSFDVWYDTTPDANQVTGAGLTDGILLMSGVLGAQASGGFNVLGNGGSTSLTGLVTYTNNAFINPDLSDTTATSTLQFGSQLTGWAAPSGMPGAAGASAPLVGNLQFQADANQNFSTTQIPEPGSLALIGLSLASLALVRRRKSI
jgi:hypothetical protein